MFDRIKTRLASEEGFTLIELLVVIVILGILIAIAVPAYLSLTSTAHQAAAQSNVRSAIPAAETYMEQSSTGDYSGMTAAGLTAVAPGVKVTTVKVSADNAAYCLDASNGSSSYYYIGGNQNRSATPPTGFATDTGVNATISPGTCSVVSG